MRRPRPTFLLAFVVVALAACQKPDAATRGREIYATAGCGLCHGPEGRGDGPHAQSGIIVPVDLGDPTAYRYGRSVEEIRGVIASGRSSERGVMPPHSHLSEEEQRDLAAYLLALSPYPQTLHPSQEEDR